MRDTWAAYLVNIATGKIEWTLGGKHSSFRFGAGAAFQWQHDVALRARDSARRHDVRRPLLPADRRRHLRHADRRRRAALVLKLDQHTHTATLVAQYGRAARPATPTTWATRSRWRTATCSSAGARSPTCRSTAAPGKLLLDGVLARLGPHLPRRGRAVGRAAADPAARRRARERRQDDGLRELERRHAGRRLAGPRRIRRGDPLTAVANAPKFGLRDRDPAASARYAQLRGRGARTRAAACSAPPSRSLRRAAGRCSAGPAAAPTARGLPGPPGPSGPSEIRWMSTSRIDILGRIQQL